MSLPAAPKSMLAVSGSYTHTGIKKVHYGEDEWFEYITNSKAPALKIKE
jgi:hypothetical protein